MQIYAKTLVGDVLHVLQISEDGRVWHRICDGDGHWTEFRLPPQVNGVRLTSVSAASAGDEPHVVVLDLNGTVWHQVRHDDGTWTGFARPPQENTGTVVEISAAGVD